MKEQSYGQKKIDGSNILILDSNFCFQMSSNIKPPRFRGGSNFLEKYAKIDLFFQMQKKW